MKGNDLYDFLQSDALKKIDSPAVTRLTSIFNRFFIYIFN